MVDQAIAPDGVVDIFAAAGLEKPNIAVISDAFLDEMRTLRQKNLALEMLKKLLNDEITSTRRTSIVQSQKFSKKLEESLNRYHNHGLEMAQIIEALIELAQTMREEVNRGEELGLKGDEYAFFEALALSESAKQVMDDDQLLTIAREVQNPSARMLLSTGGNANRCGPGCVRRFAAYCGSTNTHPTRPRTPPSSSSSRLRRWPKRSSRHSGAERYAPRLSSTPSHL